MARPRLRKAVRCAQPAAPVELLQLSAGVHAKHIGSIAPIQSEDLAPLIEAGSRGLGKGEQWHGQQNQPE